MKTEYLKSLQQFVEDAPLSSFSMEDKGYSTDKDANDFVFGNPFAFICGLIFDQSIKSSLAWSAPYELSKRLGHLCPHSIKDMPEDSLTEIIATKPSLHRYPRPMARNLIKSSQLLVDKYEGKVEQLWSEGLASKDVKKNLLTLAGVGEKKANLALTFLYHDFNIAFTDLSGGGLALDVHLNRVLTRSGYFKVKTKDEINDTNKGFSDFFGDNYSTVGSHLWLIGRKFCHEKNPDCFFCPLSEHCNKQY